MMIAMDTRTIASYHIISHHVTSRHVTSRHMMNQRKKEKNGWIDGWRLGRLVGLNKDKDGVSGVNVR